MFAIGDIVECIDTDGIPYGNLTMGKTYLVQDVLLGVWSRIEIINDMGEATTYSLNRFKSATAPASSNSFCWHEWEKYKGFTHMYQYCSKCGKKEDNWNDRTKV